MSSDLPDLHLGVPHIWRKCNCQEDRCPYCSWGAAECTVCGAAEGQLLSFCPGFWLNESALDACYTGNVRDFFRYRGRRRFLLDR